jgi:hypothetical protein
MIIVYGVGSALSARRAMVDSTTIFSNLEGGIVKRNCEIVLRF